MQRAVVRGNASLQHLYTMIPAVTDDDAPLAVNHNAPGRVELPISAAFAADRSDVGTVAQAQDLDLMVVAVGYNDVPSTIHSDA